MKTVSFIFILLFGINAFALAPKAKNYVHFFAMRSLFPLNWENPSKLALSMLSNTAVGTFGKRKIALGHNNLELVCNNETTYMGMRFSNDLEGAKLLFKDKVGLGILFHNMMGESGNKKHIDVSKWDYKKGRTSVITFILDDKKCNSLKRYIDIYKANGEQFNYGLFNNPFITKSKSADPVKVSKFKQNHDGIPYGAGCSAFMVSAMQEIDIFDMESFSKWYSEVRVPESLIGQHSDLLYLSPDDKENYNPLNRKTGHKVSFFKILKKGKRWAHKNEAHRSIVYYSPNKIFDWVGTTAPKLSSGDRVLGGIVKSVEVSPKRKKRQAYQVVIDLR